jgi:hypothetical protein
LKKGDRIEVVGDIARFLTSKVGVITSDDQRSTSVLKEFSVTLSDGTLGTFFDFQLRIPPNIISRMAFDSVTSGVPSGFRGGAFNRQVRFVAHNFDLHVSVGPSGQNRILFGQLIWASRITELAIVSLLFGDEVLGTAITDSNGEFRFQEVGAGRVNLEIVVPSTRITSSFVI